MKKNIDSFKSNSLDKKEMKSLVGGSTRCKSGECTLTIVGQHGQTLTLYGSCAEASAGFDSYPFYTICYCNAGLGSKVNVTSNNGVSRCTNTGPL